MQHTTATADLKECNPLAWRILQRVQVQVCAIFGMENICDKIVFISASRRIWMRTGKDAISSGSLPIGSNLWLERRLWRAGVRLSVYSAIELESVLNPTIHYIVCSCRAVRI